MPICVTLRNRAFEDELEDFDEPESRNHDVLDSEIVIVDRIGRGDEAPGERRTDTGPRGDRVDRA